MLFPSQTEGLHTHMATFVFCRKDDFLLEKEVCIRHHDCSRRGGTLRCQARNKKSLLGSGAISPLQKLSPTGFHPSLASSGTQFPKFVLGLTNKGN